MNKGRMIWGIVCLVVAGVLSIANVMLDESSVVFQIGNYNMPWVPPLVLAIVGIVLLATSGRAPQKEQAESKPATEVDEKKKALNKKLETTGWGCFLVMIGGFILIPDSVASKGIWSIGIGLIFLGLNAARYFNGIRMSGFTTFLGVVALASGIAQLFGVDSLEAPTVFIVLGAYLILKPWFEKRQLFGKAEES